MVNNKYPLSLFIIIIFISNTFVYSQLNKNSFKNAVILSVKAGYHLSDKKSDAEYGFAAGMIYDVSVEVHLGKGWFLGANYDYWETDDELTDFRYGKVNRKVTGNDFLFILNYRLFLKDIAFKVGAGLGNSIYKNNILFSIYRNGERNSMLNINARLGLDYFITRNIILSFETSVTNAGELKIDFGGGSSRANSLIQFKAGAGYIFRN